MTISRELYLKILECGETCQRIGNILERENVHELTRVVVAAKHLSQAIRADVGALAEATVKRTKSRGQSSATSA